MYSDFDVVKEYKFLLYLAKKNKYCGYIRREYGTKSPKIIRQELKVKSNEKLVLVTPGCGGDGYRLIELLLLLLNQI